LPFQLLPLALLFRRHAAQGQLLQHDPTTVHQATPRVTNDLWLLHFCEWTSLSIAAAHLVYMVVVPFIAVTIMEYVLAWVQDLGGLGKGLGGFARVDHLDSTR
jgi:hypothetical protein